MTTQTVQKRGRGRPRKETKSPNYEDVIKLLEEELALAENKLELERNKHAQTQDYMSRLEEELSKHEEINRALILILFLMTGGK